MAAITLMAELPCWIKLSSTAKSKFIDSIKFGVKPQSYRRYDPVTNCWYVHMTYADFVVKVATRYYDQVDYSKLPLDWQAMINETEIKMKEQVDYYQQLYVTSNAPVEVIKASFKALARIHHSDAGGNDAQMVKINIAYDNIRKLRNF